MRRYVIRRIAGVAALLIAVSALTFVIFYVLPGGDPALLRAGHNPSQRTLDDIRATLGLKRSLPEQYYIYMKHLVTHFDLGTSYQYNAPVRQLIFSRLGATASLVVGGALLWLLAGVAVGIVSAVRRGTWLDRAAMGTALVLISAPVYWLGLLALYLFAKDVGRVHLFLGYASYPRHPLDHVGAWLGSLLLPWMVMAATFAAIYARLVRAGLLETLSEDYVRTARAKGLSERRVVLRHALRPALTPIVTVFGLDLGILLGGAILTESVFDIPGLGRLSFDAIRATDLPTIQGTVLFGAFFIVVATLLVDLLYLWLDPRVRLR